MLAHKAQLDHQGCVAALDLLGSLVTKESWEPLENVVYQARKVRDREEELDKLENLDSKVDKVPPVLRDQLETLVHPEVWDSLVRKVSIAQLNNSFPVLIIRAGLERA